MLRVARYKIALSILRVLSPKLHIYARGVVDFCRPFTAFVKDHFKDETALVGAEIGVYHGENAEKMLKQLKLSCLYLVDPYIPYIGKTMLRGTSSIDYQIAAKRLERYANKQFVIATSKDSVSKVPDNLDFVYIDADHSYDHVLEDITIWLPKIKKNGVIGGHDFTDINVGVVFAVSDFVRRSKAKLHFQHPDWWFVVT